MANCPTISIRLFSKRINVSNLEAIEICNFIIEKVSELARLLYIYNEKYQVIQ